MTIGRMTISRMTIGSVLHRTGPSILTMLLVGTGTAVAQVAADGTMPASASTNEAARSGAVLEEIIVTAQRREESLQKAAIAVSALGGEQLVSARVNGPDDLARVVPALQVQPVGGTTNNFYLRGVGTQGANAFAENPIAFSVDGVFLGRPSAVTGYFYDLERVEVLKGPQGTLYGRNATGGAINVITKKPQLNEFSGTVTAEYGNYQNLRGSGAINVPIGDRTALRVAAEAADRDGYYADGYDDEHHQAARAQLRVEPTDALSVLLSGNYIHQGGKGPGSAVVPNAQVPLAPALDDRVSGAEAASIAALAAAFPGLYNAQVFLPPKGDGYIDSDFWGMSATIEAKLPIGTLTVIPAYENTDSNNLSYRPGFYGLQTEKAKQKSMEVRLASDDATRLRYVVGAFYFNQDQDAYFLFLQGLNSGTSNKLKLGTESYAGFGQLSWSMTDTLRLVGGVRYTHENKDQTVYTSAITPANPTPTPTLATGDLSFHNVSWKAGVEYDLAAASLLYATVTTGFKAGGFFPAVANNTFDPEELTAYTLGSKNRLLGDTLQLNAEVFYWDYKDQQVSYLGGVQTSPGLYATSGVTANVGQAEMYGADFDSQYLLTENDRLSANVQYLHSKYTSFNYASFSPNGAPPVLGCAYAPSAIVPSNAARFYDVDCSGRPAINSPEWTAMLGLEHTFHLPGSYDLVAGARSKYESSRYLNIEYRPEEQQDSYTSSDAWLSLEAPDKRWSVTGWVNNIEDKVQKNQAVVRPILNVVYVGLRAPRTYGVRATYNF